MRRRNRDKPRDLSTQPLPDVIAITIREMVALMEVFEHAHAQIAELSDADKETIASASGSALIPSLYARAGVALTQGRHNIPLLASEVGLFDAAVVNLESYEGNEVVLCTGYELLGKFAQNKKNNYPLHYVHGILAFADEAEDTISGSATHSLT